MIIYFADRDMNILGSASTSLPSGFKVINDVTIEDLNSGTISFECEILIDETSKLRLNNIIKVGGFILKGRGRGFQTSDEVYDSIFQIIETEYDTAFNAIRIYAEDAGLDLINQMSDAVTLNSMSALQMVEYFIPSDWNVNSEIDNTIKLSNTWDGESSVTERLISICNLFDCELFYSFTVQGFNISNKIINLIKRRGDQNAIPQFRLNFDINSIIISSSIVDLATAYHVVGGIPDGSSEPINLKNYTYEYLDVDTGDKYVVDKATGQMRNINAMSRWSSVLDNDGLIVKKFNFDTTNKAILAGEARAALQKFSKENVNYDVNFVKIPDYINVGDRINIIDENDELYLEARILRIETSSSNDMQLATVGDFIKKESGISEQIKQALSQLVTTSTQTTILTITCDKGEVIDNSNTRFVLKVSISHGDVIINDYNKLSETLGSSASLKWYKNGILTTSGVSDNGFTMTVESVESIKTSFRCELEVD